jgi:hypothetical protein
MGPTVLNFRREATTLNSKDTFLQLGFWPAASLVMTFHYEIAIRLMVQFRNFAHRWVQFFDQYIR